MTLLSRCSNAKQVMKTLRRVPAKSLSILVCDIILFSSGEAEPFTQHNKVSNNTNKKNSPSGHSRRKSSSGTPAPPKDETRLLKRKEQNRAAQRAFRERKEKHVKDLEDKVSELEAKNEKTQSENDNLKDLLSRLQTENMMLRSATFTFTVPKSGSTSELGTFPTSPSTDSLFPANLASTSTPTPPAPSNSTTPQSTFPSSTIDWNALTSFDSSMLNLLDEPQPTATDGAIHMGFGNTFGGADAQQPPSYTTIASNPALMSFASAFDSTPGDVGSYNFDAHSLSTWSPPAATNDTGSLDDLFSGMLGSTNQPLADFNVLMSPPSSISPISHHNGSTAGQSPADSAASSSSPSLTTPSPEMHGAHHNMSDCPKTKASLAFAIKAQGDSPFAPPSSPETVRKTTDPATGKMVMCQGSSFPKTEQSEKNIEVLSAWRSITSNPRFKDVDINDLCTEFTNKAKCDGTKVVLEPQGVHHILETLSSKKRPNLLPPQ
ncbi:hypothetical protein HGRIS_014726 [Hohenbuehelia grisea]|uniref:BZIP domain-containing protein n=1 Tax=Hohenbuehelia grisea TaxID=104357 RepID=A0ABR3IQI5_9AGAR